VRVWEHDPHKEAYFSVEWPKGWNFYESPAEWCGEALQEFWLMRPDEPFYGFIGDDVVLRTPGGLEILEREAGDWFIAWPNDTLQRWRLSTHFCVGGKLTNVLGWWVYPPLRHHYLDMPLYHIAINTGLGRYCPQVIFQHKHFLLGGVEKDATYSRIYGDSNEPTGEMHEAAEKIWLDYAREGLAPDIRKVLRTVHETFEDRARWEDEDLELHDA
jgi:hypothetical protein